MDTSSHNEELRKLYMEAGYALGRAVARVKYASENYNHPDRLLIEFSMPEQFKGLIDSYLEINRQMKQK